MTLPVTRGEVRYVFELQIYNCRGKNFRVMATGEDGQRELIEAPPVCTYCGAMIGFDIDYPTWSRSDNGGSNGNDAASVAKMEEFVAVKLNSFVLSNALVEHVVGHIELRKSAALDPYNVMSDSSAILSKMRDVWNGNTSFPRPSSTRGSRTARTSPSISNSPPFSIPR